MGHCEMLLAVAGLDEDAVREKTKQLASGDWSKFSPAERAAYFFARKQTNEPWSIHATDLQDLTGHSGPHRALDVLWWWCRCHSRPRVADGLQLPLERENVFKPP